MFPISDDDDEIDEVYRYEIDEVYEIEEVYEIVEFQ